MRERTVTYECRKCCEYEDDVSCIFKVVGGIGNTPTKCPFKGEDKAEWIDIEEDELKEQLHKRDKALARIEHWYTAKLNERIHEGG